MGLIKTETSATCTQLHGVELGCVNCGLTHIECLVVNECEYYIGDKDYKDGLEGGDSVDASDFLRIGAH